MTNEELESAILCMIKENFGIIYTGGLEVENLGDGYRLKLFLGRDWLSGLRFYNQGTESEFLDFLLIEFKKRNLFDTDKMKFFTGKKLPLEEKIC